jgi:Phenazine biosynthesis-like protein
MPAVVLEDRTWVEQMLQSSLNVSPEAILFAGVSEIGDVLVELTTESFLAVPYEGLNFDAMLHCDGYSRGVIICCVARQPHEDIPEDAESGRAVVIQTPPKVAADFFSRFFAPKAGVNEDPVTGSAHCVLAPYFCSKLEKIKVVGKQTSRRCGVVECLLEDTTVQLTGTVVTSVTGTLWL